MKPATTELRGMKLGLTFPIHPLEDSDDAMDRYLWYAETSDRAYVLEHGRIVHEGASADLLKDPRVLGAYLGSKKTGG